MAKTGEKTVLRIDPKALCSTYIELETYVVQYNMLSVTFCCYKKITGIKNKLADTLQHKHL